MNTLTHALLPVVGASMDGKRSPLCGGRYWNGRRALFLAACGAAPDLLDPHLSIAARHASWSHGIPALAAFSVLLLAAGYAGKWGLDTRLAIWGSAAYALHLFCDAVSGGIAPLYPFSAAVVGEYYVPPTVWLSLDMACALTVYLLMLALPRWRAVRSRDPERKTDAKTGEHGL